MKCPKCGEEGAKIYTHVPTVTVELDGEDNCSDYDVGHIEWAEDDEAQCCDSECPYIGKVKDFH